MQGTAGALKPGNGLPDLPFVLGDELLWLPPADEGEPARAAEQVRRRYGSEFHQLQSASGAGRRLPARYRWHGEKESARGDPLVQCGRGLLPEQQSGVGLLSNPDGERRRV